MTSPHPTPRDCEECDCRQYRWNGAPSMLRTDPPSMCACGHRTARHRFRVGDVRVSAEERSDDTSDLGGSE